MVKHDEDLDREDDALEDGEDFEDESAPGYGAATFLAGLVLGAVLGAGAALLVAPQRGEVTRRRLRRRWRDLRDDAADQLGEWKEDARRELGKRRKRLKRKLPIG